MENETVFMIGFAVLVIAYVILNESLRNSDYITRLDIRSQENKHNIDKIRTQKEALNSTNRVEREVMSKTMDKEKITEILGCVKAGHLFIHSACEMIVDMAKTKESKPITTKPLEMPELGSKWMKKKDNSIKIIIINTNYGNDLPICFVQNGYFDQWSLQGFRKDYEPIKD